MLIPYVYTWMRHAVYKEQESSDPCILVLILLLILDNIFYKYLLYLISKHSCIIIW